MPTHVWACIYTCVHTCIIGKGARSCYPPGTWPPPRDQDKDGRWFEERPFADRVPLQLRTETHTNESDSMREGWYRCFYCEERYMGLESIISWWNSVYSVNAIVPLDCLTRGYEEVTKNERAVDIVSNMLLFQKCNWSDLVVRTSSIGS